MASFVPSAEDVDKQLETEFLEELRDNIAKIDVTLNSFRGNKLSGTETAQEVKRLVFSSDSQSRSVNLPLITITLHQFTDYLSSLTEITNAQADDIQAFSDKIEDILDGKVTTDSSSEAEIVRALPMKTGFDIDFDDIEPQDVHLLVIVPERAMARIIEREMAACGIRTTNLRDPFMAFEMAIRLKPEMVIASRELTNELTGIDLACAFTAMPSTQDIPFALLSSYDKGHNALQGLPERAALLKKGPAFGEDLATALERFKLI